jgi:hypothetical protein
MMADREEALGDVCDYNNAGTLRVLNQYRQITGKLPNLMHAGVKLDDTPMDGLPAAQQANMSDPDTFHELTQAEVDALSAMGISQVAKDTGLNVVNLAEDVVVVECTPDWRDDSEGGGAEYQFDGRTITWFNAEDASRVFVFWVAPSTDWDRAGAADNQDWSKGAIKIGLDLQGKCPIPVEGLNGDPEFAYYMAYVAVATDYYEAAQSGGIGTFPAFSFSPSKFFSAGEAQSAIETDVAIHDDFVKWTDGDDWTDGSRVAEFENASSETGTSTFTVTDMTGSGTAKLVGTSCPECGVMNP